LDKGTDTDTELSTLGAQLRVNCLTFCQGLHNHHTGEDTVLFPLIAERHPGSTAALARLREEHDQIATLVDALRETLTTPTDPATTRAEVNRLTTALEAHLTYEEQELIPLFDAAP
jgi:iron-sulfur cluster repair protein YtfE (RIC family)